MYPNCLMIGFQGYPHNLIKMLKNKSSISIKVLRRTFCLHVSDYKQNVLIFINIKLVNNT